MVIRLALTGLAMAIFGTNPAAAEEAAEPKTVDVMVLGTWHFANNNRDIHNVQSDDVRSPQQQAELKALSKAIAGYRPTKIMVERVARTSDLVDLNFASFTPTKLESERDERVQIGYRLAYDLKLDKVYAIDEQGGAGGPDYFPFGKVMAFAKDNGMEARLQTIMDQGAAATRDFEEKQGRMSIAELLIDSNGPDGYSSGIGPYYEMLHIGDAERQPGADLNAMWYLRNAKIFAKLMTVAEPGDRILVIYGAGHNYWLRHFAGETPGFRNVDPVPYLKAAIAE